MIANIDMKKADKDRDANLQVKEVGTPMLKNHTLKNGDL